MVNQAKLDQMLSNLGTFIEALRKLSLLSREDFLSDSNKIGNAKYQFIVAIESSIDIANHIISSEGLRFPETNAESFRVLVEAGFLPSEGLSAWMQMASFRNRLVHLYWDVDDSKVYDYLTHSLDDLDLFKAKIAAIGE